MSKNSRQAVAANIATKKKLKDKSSPPSKKSNEVSQEYSFKPRLGVDKQTLDKDKFLTDTQLSDTLLTSNGLEWEWLEWIYTYHCLDQENLRTTANGIVEMLRKVPQVHSLKLRIKDPVGLVKKIIRKKSDSPDRVITPDNYDKEITDLIGIRALHLFKEDWLPVHKFIMETWESVEPPIAYYREGDPQDIIDGFTGAGCEARKHDKRYRSVHYLIKSQPAKQLYIAEIQVRTIFEEGWAEIDHVVRYPDASEDSLLNRFLDLFNRAAGMADEMGSYIRVLRSRLEEDQKSRDRALQEQSRLLAEVEDQINKLSMSEKQRKNLEKELSSLRSYQKESAELTVGSSLTAAIRPYATFGIANKFVAIGEASTLGFISDKKCANCGRTIPQSHGIVSLSGDLCNFCILNRNISVKID